MLPDDTHPTKPEDASSDEANHVEQDMVPEEFSDAFEFLNALRMFPLCEARWIFRGQSEDWPLNPLIMRIPVNDVGYEISEAERDTLSSFKRGAHHYLQHLPKDDDALEWLALMQHFGVPTRLLD